MTLAVSEIPTTSIINVSFAFTSSIATKFSSIIVVCQIYYT